MARSLGRAQSAVPELATTVPTQGNGGVSKDGLTITYHLRKGVKWSDGEPFDADDVVFSTAVVNYLANNEGGRFDQLAHVSEPDKFTVAFHLKKPYSPSTASFSSSATPASAPYAVKMATTRYDPVAANALLDRAGWKRGPDGIRAKNGAKLNLTFATRAGRPETDAQIELVRQDWKKLGAGVRVTHFPSAKMFAAAAQGGVIYGNTWDVIAFIWAADPIGDYSGNYGCQSFPPHGQNDLRWCNATAQHAMDAFFGHYAQNQRNADLKIIMSEFVKDAPSIVSFLRVDMFGYNRDLKNYHPNNLTPFDNMMDVDI